MVSITVGTLILGLWWFGQPNAGVSRSEQSTNTTSLTTQSHTNNATEKQLTSAGGSNTNSSSPQASSSAASASMREAYDKGLISKGEAMHWTLMKENKKSLDLYGRVVDQYGQPVAGATVRGAIGIYISLVKSGGEFRYTETDALGRFSFIGIHGAGIGIWPQKEGFYYNLKQPSERPSDYKPDPNNPLVFTMWKLRGAEPMTHREFHFRVPYDGTPTVFDLSTRNQGPGGDLRITLLRSGFALRTRYDWTAKIEMLSGELLPESDPYPYWAPENGYQPVFEASMSSNNVPWCAELKQSFYIKNAKGQFGRMIIDLATGATRPDSGITIETWINPSGSRNLEFDLLKKMKEERMDFRPR